METLNGEDCRNGTRRDKYGIHFYQHHQKSPADPGQWWLWPSAGGLALRRRLGVRRNLDDNAPGCVGGLRDYADPKLLKPGRPAFVALGDNALRVELLQKLAAAGYDTPVFISDMAAVSPSAVLEPGLCDPAPGLCGCRCASGRGLHHQRRGHRGPQRGPGAAACMLPPAAS